VREKRERLVVGIDVGGGDNGKEYAMEFSTRCVCHVKTLGSLDD
jgi:hypothetical protein